MKKHLSFRHALTAAAISLAAIASFAASAQAATDTIYKYTKPRTGYFMAHPFAMVPDGHAPDYEINYAQGSLTMEVTGLGCFQAAVNLPNGATITNLAATYSAQSDHLHFRLYRHKMGDGSALKIADFTTTNMTGTRRTDDLPLAPLALLINNNLYLYSFTVCFNNVVDYFYGAKITYTVTNAGD